MRRLIDANALWEKFESEPWYDNADRDEIALPMVLDAPTVEAEPVVHGRWLDGGKTFFGEQKNYICSNCHSHTGIVKFNYCPNCGAKMDGDGNG